MDEENAKELKVSRAIFHGRLRSEDLRRRRRRHVQADGSSETRRGRGATCPHRFIGPWSCENRPLLQMRVCI